MSTDNSQNVLFCTIVTQFFLTGKPTGKRRLGRPRHRWEDNIRMDLEEIGMNAGNWADWLRIGIIGEPF